MLRRSLRLTTHPSTCTCETCAHAKGYPACRCDACCHGAKNCPCEECIHSRGYPTCTCEDCVHTQGWPICLCMVCVHVGDPSLCVCRVCVSGRHVEGCTCSICTHVRGYPVCHCYECARAFGIPSRIARCIENMEDGELELGGNDLLEVPDVMPVGMTHLLIKGAWRLRSLVVPEGVIHLHLDWPTRKSFTLTLPSTLEELEIIDLVPSYAPFVLPEGLKSLLIFGKRYSSIDVPALPAGLKRLTICFCRLKTIPPLPKDLEELCLAHNSITKLPTVWPVLRSLDLQGNPVTGIREGNVVYGLREGLVEYNHGMYQSRPQMEAMPDSYLMVLRDRVEDRIEELDDSDIALGTNSFRSILQGVLGPCLAILAQREGEAMRRCEARCRAIKEELMMNRWHPARIGPLIEAGWDVEDL